jgi:hypothetical protein
MTETEVISQVLKVPYGGSQIAHNHGLIVSIREWDRSSLTLIYGSPGSPNAQHKLQLGDAVLYETPSHGMAELRLMKLNSLDADVLFTKISPRVGFGVSIDTSEAENAPFAQDEIQQIRRGIESIKVGLAERSDISKEQLELLNVRLDDIAAAPERMGKKDWIMFATGNITNFIIGAALAPEAAKALVTAMNNNLGWVFKNAIRLLGAS